MYVSHDRPLLRGFVVPDRQCLLLTFRFPPYPGVGARRWDRLAKYLAREGVQVHVLTVDWSRTYPGITTDFEPGIHMHTVPCIGPYRLVQRIDPGTAWGRTIDRVRGVARRWDWTGFADEARWWGLTMLRTADALIREHGIPVIVATGPPHMVNYWAAILKQRHPALRLIQDFRDPWTDQQAVAQGHHGALALAKRREATAIREADGIVTVGADWGRMFAERSSHVPVTVIPNGFDPEELAGIMPEGARPFHLMHAGNLFAGREAPLRAFLGATRVVAGEIPEMRLVFRGGFPGTVLGEFRDLTNAGILDVSDPIDQRRAFELMADAFACLHFNSPGSPGALSTKIYEYGALRRPVLSVNYGGEIEGLIREHNLGRSVRGDDPNEIAHAIRELHLLWTAEPDFVQPVSNMEDFSYPGLAARYTEVLFPRRPTSDRDDRSSRAAGSNS